MLSFSDSYIFLPIDLRGSPDIVSLPDDKKGVNLQFMLKDNTFSQLVVVCHSSPGY